MHVLISVCVCVCVCVCVQSMIPGVMISLLDSNQDRCAVQLCHYLMYADDRNIDYSVVGWLMVNVSV